jgi:hypothetical protein
MSNFDNNRLIAQLDNACDAPTAAVEAIQHHGFAALLEGRAATLAEISDQCGLTVEDLKAGIAGLAEAGRLETIGDRVTGVRGLTLSETAHALTLPNATLNTWCALDAIGIPVALGLDASVTTTCPQCEETLHIEIQDGEPEPNDHVRLFCPTGPCSNVRTDFCAAANLFCNADHLNEWIQTHPADGDELDLATTTTLGREMWAMHSRTDPDIDIE